MRGEGPRHEKQWGQDMPTEVGKTPSPPHSPTADLRMFIGATLSQAPALGLYLSTELRQLVPSLPPATYRAPSSTATPAELRRLSMDATDDQAFTWGRGCGLEADPPRASLPCRSPNSSVGCQEWVGCG